MEKSSKKSKWQSVAASAKSRFWSYGTEIPKASVASSMCSQTNSSDSVESSDITFNSASPACPNLAGLKLDAQGPKDIDYSSNPSHGGHLVGYREVVAASEKATDTSLTSPAAGDRKRTVMRYVAAVEEMKAALSLRRPGWEEFEFPEFDVIPESDGSLALLQEAIDEKLNSCQDLGDKSIWQQGKTLAERLFVALSPFANNFLTVAKGASESAANREIARKGEIEKTLDFIARRLDQLKVIADLPDNIVHTDDLVNRAMDVRSASLKYIAVHIRHESQYFGIAGRVATTIFMGDNDCNCACTVLKEAIAEFNASLSIFGHSIGIKTLEEVKELHRDFAAMQILSGSTRQLTRDRFIVPYHRNEHFMGRHQLLTDIYNNLCQTLPNHHNHRLALYGLGGVGKTQLALEYAYTHQLQYDGIYWISAVNQISILSGFRDIAKRTNCLGDESNLDLCEKAVISWLNQQDRWLLIYDNLDDATVIDGLLPNVSLRQHILFTTRNPNSDEIPAEGIEIGVMAFRDAVDLLILRSRLNHVENVPEQKAEAERIVQELGFLPLAIEQAGAYIREVSKNISKFLPSYRNDRQKYHQRVPRGNWKYQKSIATTWRLSFERIEQANMSAAQLLRLLSFLNPDNILTDFLEAGCQALDLDLQSIITESDTLDEALSELERWSIIRRQNDEAGGERITIHRLVQLVIKDEMTEVEFSYFTRAAIALCDRAFPSHTTNNDSRMVCRRYQAQAVIPLSMIPTATSNVQLEVLERIAWFLHDDGKYAQSRELRSRTLEMYVVLKGLEDPDTLLVTSNLALTYRREGRLKDAAQLQLEVMEAMERVLGAEHRDTLRVMSELALTYLYEGRCDHAFRLHEKVLEARTRLLGEDHPDTLTAMSRLAATFRDQGQWDDAINLHEKVLCARRRHLDEDHPDTLMAMSSLAYSYIGALRWSEALSLLEVVVESRTRVLGEEHMDTLVAMSRLGHAYSRLRRWDVALELQNKSLYFLKRTCGEEHRDTLTAMSWLASTYWDMDKGQRNAAVSLYQAVLRARRKMLGDDHPITLDILKTLQVIKESK